MSVHDEVRDAKEPQMRVPAGIIISVQEKQNWELLDTESLGEMFHKAFNHKHDCLPAEHKSWITKHKQIWLLLFVLKHSSEQVD